jgi:hypothetical protein
MPCPCRPLVCQRSRPGCMRPFGKSGAARNAVVVGEVAGSNPVSHPLSTPFLRVGLVTGAERGAALGATSARPGFETAHGKSYSSARQPREVSCPFDDIRDQIEEVEPLRQTVVATPGLSGTRRRARRRLGALRRRVRVALSGADRRVPELCLHENDALACRGRERRRRMPQVVRRRQSRCSPSAGRGTL